VGYSVACEIHLSDTFDADHGPLSYLLRWCFSIATTPVLRNHLAKNKPVPSTAQWPSRQNNVVIHKQDDNGAQWGTRNVTLTLSTVTVLHIHNT
jgi:hypothetical protein